MAEFNSECSLCWPSPLIMRRSVSVFVLEVLEVDVNLGSHVKPL